VTKIENNGKEHEHHRQGHLANDCQEKIESRPDSVEKGFQAA
jgi:hypothetical protein